METVITPVHLALFEAVTRIIDRSGTSAADATAALIDVTLWVADALPDGSASPHRLAEVVADRARTAMWAPPFREV